MTIATDAIDEAFKLALCRLFDVLVKEIDNGEEVALERFNRGFERARHCHAEAVQRVRP